MNKNNFYLQGTDSQKESFNFPELIEFEWNIIYDCNYRCTYCFFNGKWEEYSKRNRILKVKEWMECWQRIYDKYGRCSILVTGGEPFGYPDFIELIRQLATIHYPINISTNSSGDLEKLVEKLKPLDVIKNPDNKRISVTLSFHPEYDSLDTILDRNQFLKANGIDAEFINVVAYPPLLKYLNGYVKRVAQEGHRLKVIPFIGIYNGDSYPESYTEQEREYLGIDNSWWTNLNRKGMVCSAGMKSALIFPDGKVARCGQIGERYVIGSFFSEEFELLKEPLGCDVHSCPCLETPEK